MSNQLHASTFHQNRTRWFYFFMLGNITICPDALRFSPLGCGAARVHHSASLYVVYSGTLRSSFLPVAFYAPRRLQYSDSVSPSFSARCELLDEGRTLFLVLRWRNSAGSVPVIICRGRRFVFAFSFLSFSTKCGTCVLCAASVECSLRSWLLD